MKSEVINGDCLEVMKGMDANSVDAIVTDPPYGLSFMGKSWDHGVPGVPFWEAALQVAKPGSHLLAFGGTRTFHRLTVAIEDAGWEIRDCVMWVYGSGFPKSLDVSKAIDKAAGAERERVAGPSSGGMKHVNCHNAIHGYRPNDYAENGNSLISGDPITEAARQWQGWGTALKPAWEPIIVARKPLDGTVAENVQRHGTGAVNVDGCRVPSEGNIGPVSGKATLGGTRDGYDRPWKHDPAALAARQERANAAIEKANTLGRWPANLIHDGSDEVTDLVGSAARFFYCPKASKAEREAGLEEMESVYRVNGNKWTDQDYRVTNGERPQSAESGPRKNIHPTVKPIDLMSYLCRLITPPSGTILDPFMGSGSTGVAALREGFNFIGIELNAEYAEIAQKRIENELNKAPLFEAMA